MQKFQFLFFSGFLLTLAGFFAIATAACSTNCSMTSDPALPPPYNQWAWNDVISWINLKKSPPSKEVLVSDAAVTGIATSGVGDIYFDCASFVSAGGALPSGPPPKTCSDYSKWKVSNDYTGQLDGYAWNDTIGWISFWGQNPDLNTCSPPPIPPATPSCYRTTIDNGNFSGYAWNDVVGWISFCGSSSGQTGCLPVAVGKDYQAKTSWTKPANFSASLESSVINAGSKVTLNSILWQGAPNGGTVTFQVASGDTDTSPSLSVYSTSYTGGPGVSISLNNDYVGKQYFRYKITLDSGTPNPAIAKSPRVDDVIINWSR